MGRPLKKRCPRCAYRKTLWPFNGHDCCSACRTRALEKADRKRRAKAAK